MVHRFVVIEVVHPNRPPVAAVFLNSRLDATLRRRTTHVVFRAKGARPVRELSLEAQGVAKAYKMTKPRSSDVLLLGKGGLRLLRCVQHRAPLQSHLHSTLPVVEAVPCTGRRWEHDH